MREGGREREREREAGVREGAAYAKEAGDTAGRHLTVRWAALARQL